MITARNLPIYDQRVGKKGHEIHLTGLSCLRFALSVYKLPGDLIFPDFSPNDIPPTSIMRCPFVQRRHCDETTKVRAQHPGGQGARPAPRIVRRTPHTSGMLHRGIENSGNEIIPLDNYLASHFRCALESMKLRTCGFRSPKKYTTQTTFAKNNSKQN